MGQSHSERVGAAVKLIKRAVAQDDQTSYDFVAAVIEREQLYLDMTKDDGTPINSMAELHADLWELAKECGTAETE
jgi:hypothetical protein